MVRVKVCGLTSERDVEACVEAGVDAVGFIFASSARQLSPVQAERLAELVPASVTCVGVFAGNTAVDVTAALDRCRLDLLQFSGGEEPAFCGSFGKPTIVVVHARPHNHALAWPPKAADLKTARAIATMADSADAGRFGGTGAAVPLDIAARMRSSSPLPFVLAGGLRPDNVAHAITCVKPWAVDVCSGVERRGRKEPVLVEQFVRAAHSAQTGER